MYFVDREKIEEILSFMEQLLTEIKKDHPYKSFPEQLVLERVTHLYIESILDVGNMMIDGFIMRDPGSYEDIIDILTDEKVLDEREQGTYKELIQIRKQLVQEYTKIDHSTVLKVWEQAMDTVSRFPDQVRRYLDQELGPVSAFSKK